MNKNFLNNFIEFSDIFKKIPIGIILFDNDLKIIEFNDAFLKLFEIKRSKITGSYVTDILDEKILPALKTAIKGNEGFYENECLPNFYSGKIYISVHTKPHIFRNKNVEFNGGIAIFKDITEDRIAEKAMSRSYDIFQTVTDNIRALIFVINPDSSKIIFMNSIASELFGKHTDKLCYEIFFTGRKTICKNCPKNNLKDNNIFNYEYFNKNLNKWFSCSYTFIKWIDSKKVLLLSLIDITEKKNIELKIKKQNEKLENTLLQVTEQNIRINHQSELLKISGETKDRMFSIIGHDLRGPVGNIKNALDILLEDYDVFDKNEMKDFIESVRNSAGSAFNLLANLLYWAKNQSGKMGFMSEHISFNDIIEENINLFTANLEHKKIKLIYNSHEEYQLFADENMLNTVVRNLISNAVKFTPFHGKITIKIIKHQNDEILFMVEDNGVGIKKENLSKIFNENEFFTTYGTDNEKGSGLGLVVCKEFVERHGGKIWVNSSSGKGTIFSFVIPINN